MLEDERSQGPVVLRRKRAAAKEKNTCQLYIQTDQFFFKYYGSREAVIAQVCCPAHKQTLQIWPQCRLSCLESLNLEHLSLLEQALSLQISSHVKAINSIYQVTDFKGIRNISFMVKRIRVG